jgi:dihydroxy-acid dehydratase
MQADIVPLLAGLLIFLASLASLGIGLSVAIIEILLGAIFGNLGLIQAEDWMMYLAGFGGIVLTLLAGTEIDIDLMREKFKESVLIGTLPFIAPFAGVFLYTYYFAGWSLPAALIAGTALSTTSLAVVYSVLVETGLSRTEIGKTIMAATFITDMGTANTMQSMPEALGMSLPGSAVIPAYQKDVRALAENSGKRIMDMLEEGLKTREILTKEAFENAIMVHAALAGSLNAIMHLAAIAHEAGLTLHPKLWDELNREIPYLLNVRPSGKYPAVLFWYAGGIYGVISEIREHLHLDAMTVTGKTMGENLKDPEKADYFTKVCRYLKNFKVSPEEVIAPVGRPRGEGALAILSGNLAPDYAAIKYSALPREMFHHIGPAVVFEREKAAFDAVINGEIEPGSMIVLRYAGPRGLGLPEMFYLTEALASNKELDTSTALITDGRFSGASRGPCVGYLCPEAMDGGPIAVVENGDLIELDVPNRSLNIIGVRGKNEDPDTINRIIDDRLSRWKPPENKYTGVLRLFTKLATPAMEGAYMKF